MATSLRGRLPILLDGVPVSVGLLPEAWRMLERVAAGTYQTLLFNVVDDDKARPCAFRPSAISAGRDNKGSLRSKAPSVAEHG
jgi:hypothetical protein